MQRKELHNKLKDGQINYRKYNEKKKQKSINDNKTNI